MLNPWMLMGLLGLAVPTIIHLINRRRLRPQQLATLGFLEETDVANVFDRVPRDLLQLLLRLLLLALFIWLMARMTLPADQPSPRALVVVLDNSASMQQTLPSGVTLFERHRQQVEELVAGMRPDDLFSFVLAGDRIFAATGLTRDKDVVQQAVAAAWISDGGGRSVMAAVEQGLAELQGQRAPDCALLVFSDQQEANYLGSPPSRALRQLLAKGRARLMLISEELPPVQNFAVGKARFQPASVYLGGSSKLTTSVRNASDAPGTVEVALHEGAAPGETRNITLAPGEVAHVDLVRSFEMPVDVACRAEISTDGFPADNAFHVPMRVRKRRQLALAAPAKYAPSDEVATGYSGVDLLAYAVNPEEALGLAAGIHTSLRRITPAVLPRLPLSIYSTIILYGLAELPSATTLADLRSYVSSGGGLWIVPTSDLNPVRFNETFAELLGGLQLGVLQQPEEPVFLDKNEARLGVPLLLPLLREEWGDPDEIPVLRYFRLQSRGTAAAALVARNGDPLSAAIPVGEGRVYLQLFGCDIGDTAFPRSPAFLPMVQTVLDSLCGGSEELLPDMMRAGDTAYLQLPRYKGLGGAVDVRGPADYRFPLAASGQDTRVADMYVAGSYKVTHPDKQTGRVRWLAVNPVAEESALATLAPDAAERIFGDRNVLRLASSDLAGVFSRRREALPWLLVLVFAALMLEAGLGTWQSRRKRSTGD